jgi:hypothetical protein
MPLFLDQLLNYLTKMPGTKPRPIKTDDSGAMQRVPVLIALYTDPHKREPIAYVEAGFWKFHPYEKRKVDEQGNEIVPELQAEFIIGCCIPNPMGTESNSAVTPEVSEPEKPETYEERQKKLTQLLFPNLPLDFGSFGGIREPRPGSKPVYKEPESPTFENEKKK